LYLTVYSAFYTIRNLCDCKTVLRQREEVIGTPIKILLQIAGEDHSTMKGQDMICGQGSPNPRDQTIKAICRPERVGGKGRKRLLH